MASQWELRREERMSNRNEIGVPFSRPLRSERIPEIEPGPDDFWAVDDNPPVSEPTPPQAVEVEFTEPASAMSRGVERPPSYWKLRNGRFIAIREMENSHLDNCINLISRQANTRGRRASGGVYQELLNEKARREAEIRQEPQPSPTAIDENLPKRRIKS